MMAGVIDGHDGSARLLLFALLQKIGQGFLDKHLHLPSFATREVADGRQNFGIDLGGEFFAGPSSQNKSPLADYISMFTKMYHNTSSYGGDDRGGWGRIDRHGPDAGAHPARSQDQGRGLHRPGRQAGAGRSFEEAATLIAPPGTDLTGDLGEFSSSPRRAFAVVDA